MCGLHLDKSSHFHIHYCFWEKEPKVKNQRAAGYIYRKKGKMPLSVIMKMTERLNAFTINDEIAKRRDEAVDALKDRAVYGEMLFCEDIRERIKDLADKLPKDKPLWYGSKEMKPFRPDIDEIVNLLICTDKNFFKKDIAFFEELARKEAASKEKMKSVYGRLERLDKSEDEREGDKTKVHKIESIERLRYDYKRRLGNIVLNKVRYIQNNTFIYDREKKHKTNDGYLKRNIAMSERKIGKMTDRFFSSFAALFEVERASHSNRLRGIGQEVKEKYDKEQARIANAEELRKARLQAEEQAEAQAAENNNYYNSR